MSKKGYKDESPPPQLCLMDSVVNLRTVLIDIHEGCASVNISGAPSHTMLHLRRASGQTGSTTPSDGYTDDGSVAKN
uniref:Uncharacterized protein n=1 Tax=Panagrellus redivivus TaxID=6233 RepID=A0A7E4V761_PANRE